FRWVASRKEHFEDGTLDSSRLEGCLDTAAALLVQDNLRIGWSRWSNVGLTGRWLRDRIGLLDRLLNSFELHEVDHVWDELDLPERPQSMLRNALKPLEIIQSLLRWGLFRLLRNRG